VGRKDRSMATTKMKPHSINADLRHRRSCYFEGGQEQARKGESKEWNNRASDRLEKTEKGKKRNPTERERRSEMYRGRGSNGEAQKGKAEAIEKLEKTGKAEKGGEGNQNNIGGEEIEESRVK
jgi:hypothetical protein